MDTVWKRLPALVGMLHVIYSNLCYAQVEHASKVEAGYIEFLTNSIIVDAAPGWRGYNIDEENGIDINFTSGLRFKGNTFTGIGLGYVNFRKTWIHIIL